MAAIVAVAGCSLTLGLAVGFTVAAVMAINRIAEARSEARRLRGEVHELRATLSRHLGVSSVDFSAKK